MPLTEEQIRDREHVERLEQIERKQRMLIEASDHCYKATNRITAADLAMSPRAATHLASLATAHATLALYYQREAER
jgi:hypothetical protein